MMHIIDVGGEVGPGLNIRIIIDVGGVVGTGLNIHVILHNIVVRIPPSFAFGD